LTIFELKNKNICGLFMAGIRLIGAFVDLILIQSISEVAVVGIPFLL